LPNKLRSIRGVSLVEVMIALTILLIVFMGLIQASIVAIQSNMRNLLRDEAVSIASEQISRLRGANFDDMNNDTVTDGLALIATNFTAANGWPPTVARNYRNAAVVNFAIARNTQSLDANNKQITVTATWQWQGENFQHQIMTTRQR
jgi:prepilin-type N-terminal cleavage/methylation domain-containing protein